MIAPLGGHARFARPARMHADPAHLPCRRLPRLKQVFERSPAGCGNPRTMLKRFHSIALFGFVPAVSPVRAIGAQEDDMDLRGYPASNDIDQITRADRARAPAAGLIWITGYSGAGKTTIGRKVEARLRAEGTPTVFLDGDDLRAIFAGRWGYDRQARVELAHIYFRLCSH